MEDLQSVKAVYLLEIWDGILRIFKETNYGIVGKFLSGFVRDQFHK